MKNILLSITLLVATCLTAAAQSDFPGGYQSKAQGYSTVNSYLLAENISLTWDYGVGDYGAYTLTSAKVVYDRTSKIFYLRFTNKDDGIRYLKLYSADHSSSVTDYFPGPDQTIAGGYTTVNSYFLADSVSLTWDSNVARQGAYVLSGAKIAYDRNSKKFYLYDSQNWFLLY